MTELTPRGSWLFTPYTETNILRAHITVLETINRDLLAELEGCVRGIIENFPSRKKVTCRACDTTFPHDTPAHADGCPIPTAEIAIAKAKEVSA